MCSGMLSYVWFFVTPWIIATRLLCPWNFPGKNTGAGCHLLLQGISPDSGIKPESLVSPALAGKFFTTVPPSYWEGGQKCWLSVRSISVHFPYIHLLHWLYFLSWMCNFAHLLLNLPLHHALNYPVIDIIVAPLCFDSGERVVLMI